MVPMEDRHEASPQPPRNDTSDSGFADLLRDLSLTPPPLLESTDKSDPPSPPGHPDPASQELRHVSRQRSGDDPDATERRQSRRISLGDNGLPFELTNNEFVTAMRHYYSSNNLGGSWALNAEDIKNLQDHSQYVDWSQEKNLQKLKDVRKVVRSIFWGFEDIANVDDAEVPVLVISEDLRSRIKRLARQIVEGKAFTLYFIFLTLYALFGPDLLLMSGHSGMDQDNLTLSVINILVFLCFAFEEMLMCWVLPGYFLSLRFVMDTCATLSILGDTAIVAEIINTDAAVAMRTTRAMRGAGRSTRLISILRSLRVWQILKLLPRLQRLTESGTKELAMLMWHKRLQNVAGFIDDEGIGELSDEQMDFFTSALRLEFPKPQDEDKMKCLTWFLEKLSESTHATALRSWGQNLIPWWRSAKVEEADFSRYSLEIRSCWDMDMGQRAFRRCLDDITTMKASCTVLYQSMLGLILKICIIVLALLLMLQFVSGSLPEIARKQGLAQLQVIDSEDSSDLVLCEMITKHFAESFHRCKLVLLVINQRVLWNETCTCCDGMYRSLLDEPEALSLIEDAIDVTGFEIHETLLEQVQLGNFETFAVFDIHEESRHEASESLKFTLSVVAMLAILMLYFSADIMHMSSNNCLHPLWDLMDDMNAMKLIELITASSSFRKLEPVQEAMEEDPETRRCKCKAFAPVPVAQELLGLRRAMSLLESAMIAWSKYVPVILLKQVMAAGVEANIGCIPSKVTIFFCDIQGFKDICKGKDPTEVLSLLDVVLEGVNQALEQNGGTLLEFIGDEVLAVFNAPQKMDMHNLAAVNAAIAAIDISAELEAEPVNLQCSVHTGEVLAGNIGSPTRMKYGLLGDGVNLAARLKSLNTRYGTQLLVSAETLRGTETLRDVGVADLFVARTVGKLVLKGRTTPTHTMEVIGRKGQVPQDLEQAAEFHEEAIEHFGKGHFEEAKVLFEKVNRVFVQYDEGSCPQDAPSSHMIDLCNMYINNPPNLQTWDGSEHLNKKAWS